MRDRFWERDISCALATAVLLAASACSEAADQGPHGTWVGTVTTEGNVTTVVNESGSVWGGTARLVEEASIGLEAGSDEYMFSFVMSVFGTDEHIYVADEQANLVRRYDHEGVYVRTIGGVGQGPGEYVDPRVIAVAPDGRILISDSQVGRTQVYGANGATLESWLTLGVACCAWPIVFDADGVPWFPTRERRPNSFEPLYGVQAYGPEGPIGENVPLDVIDVPDVTVSVGGRELPVPFVSRFVWTPAGRASMLAGANHEYRFELQRHGEAILEVEKYWEPVAVDPAHAEWRRRATVARGRRFEPGWSWNGSEIPEHLPAFAGLIAASGGGFWVTRYGQPRRLTECVEDPLAEADGGRSAAANGCWRDVWILDAFDKNGKYLGEIDTPLNMMPFPLFAHVVGDRVIGVEVDDLGTFMVKRYRLLLPEEE